MSATPPAGSAGPILAASARVLRPLVRLALAHQIGLHALVELLKRLLVEEAASAVQAAGGKATDSRIHTLTGVHRKDVRRLRRVAPATAASKIGEESIGARLIARWTADERFLNNRRRPRVLALRRARADAPPSFEDLVNEVGRQDVRPRAVLEELLRLKVVRMKGNRVALNEAAFVPTEGFEEKLFYLGLNTGDHAAAAVFNLTGGRPPMLERSVHYDALREASVSELETLARAEGMRLLQMLNRRALALQRRDRNQNGRQRFNAGVFFYREGSNET